jgi:ABC-type bacteriocin/lantibiotic exporter with double-glycine peptidase domain
MDLKKIKKTHVLQQDQSDCGVACLLSLIQWYDGKESLEKLREWSGTTRQGTTLLGLYQTAHRLGFTAQGNEADIQALIDHGKPVILHVLIENHLQHYMVCYGYQDGKFIVGDPAHGVQEFSAEDLEKIWQSKACLTLEPKEHFVTQKETTQNRNQWFKDLLKNDFQLLGISIAIGVGIAVLGMAMSIFSQKLIDDILPSKNTSKLFYGIGLLTFLLLIRVGLSALREFLLTKQTKDFNNRIVDKFFFSLLHLPKPFFDTRKIGELVARLNDTGRVQRVIKLVANNLIIDTLVVLVSFGFLFYYFWQVGLISLISIPIYFFIIYRYNRKIIESQKMVMQSYAHSESNYITTMQGIATIKNFNKQTIFQKINQLVFGVYQEKNYELGILNVKLIVQAGIAGVLFTTFILAYTSYKVFQGNLTLGELMAVLGIIGTMIPSITNLALISIPINEAKIAFNRMFEFASIQPESKGNTELEHFQSLELHHLSFRFAGRSQLLKNVDFSIKKGEWISIVGESGSGKSTLGQILQKFYDFENGQIRVNQQFDFREISTDNWRNLIGVIPQEINIFNGNVIDNILIGAQDNPEYVVQFCRMLGFEKFINELPQGYATLLGEEGINLSGGQKQIIALARVLYKKPQFLILDEATAAMDRNTEKFTLEILQKIKSEVAILFISHRLHSLKNYTDRIYVLENGIISHSGTHEELLLNENFYSAFWKELQ